MMKNKLKLLVIKTLRHILKIFFIFPMKKNKILFSSFEGRQYSDNPKYMYEYLNKIYKNKYEYIWVLNQKNTELRDCRIVKFLSFKHVYHLLTSKYIISNLGIEPFIPKRHNQVILNTWHGSGAYKGESLGDKIKATKYSIDMRDYRGRIIDYYVSGCQRFADVYVDAWNTQKEKFILAGTPRNDILLSENLSSKREQILDNLNLSTSKGYILYAPTFRGYSFRKHQEFDSKLNFQLLIQKCNEKFGKEFNILYREHIGTNGNNHIGDSIIDVSAYPDMQELLLVSDILITDYSSCMWDFSLLYRPGFIYAPDLEDYLSERDFYTPLKDWPFCVATTSEELFSLINNYDYEESKLKIEKHFKLLKSFENGKATQEVIKKIGL